ncbi:hypothetical protein HPB51_002175 [Rhipicephalus microplus]|uniref:L1 transposable element RRM domain-containing protein n=1 Tax=Rhipicephalus microplus TaxID=6941 RepID=A0A9J6EJV7_RHIMP|nr:hypothetical protein HPB51_002175 [Rhipicephalus microplus]
MCIIVCRLVGELWRPRASSQKTKFHFLSEVREAPLGFARASTSREFEARIDPAAVLYTPMTLANLKRRLSKIEERLESVDNLSESVKAVGSVVQESQEQLKTIEQKQTHQANLVVDDLNNRMRRNNLVFKGVPEQAAEKWSDTEKLIHEFVTENLGIQPGEIERAHRVGQRKPDRTRPVVVKFLNFKDKSNILKNAFKLKDLATPRVWIEEDFSPRVQLIRKTLRDFARAKRQKNEKYKLQFDKLIMAT